MEEENYFDKFVKDLEKRENESKKQREMLQKAEDLWAQRRELDVRYRETPANRLRYEK